MSEWDRNRWNARYRAGAYAGRTWPSDLVAEHAPTIVASQRAATEGERPLRALDLACGAGRNALYLAALGYRVDAVDVSAEALERGRVAARRGNLGVDWLERDLDLGLARGLGPYDLILIVRYFDLSLIAAAAERLRPGGYLICEAHLVTEEAVVGPRSQTFRARPGELRTAAADLDVVVSWEGIQNDPDGRAAALARLVAWRP